MTVFILIPLGVVVFYALTDPATGMFSLHNLGKIFTGSFPRIFGRSVWYSLVASLICLVIGYPVAYWIARQKAGVQRFLYLLVMLPMCMSFLLRTLAWVGLLRDTGIINQFLGLFGIGPLPLIRTTGAVILGMVYNYLPYMILPLYTIIVKIDPLLIEAAEDLGCSSRHVLTRVIIPLSMPGIISGVTMVFVPAVSLPRCVNERCINYRTFVADQSFFFKVLVKHTEQCVYCFCFCKVILEFPDRLRIGDFIVKVYSQKSHKAHSVIDLIFCLIV